MTSTQHKRYVDAQIGLNKNNKTTQTSLGGRSRDERRAEGGGCRGRAGARQEISSSSAESGAAITALSYGSRYRLRFSPLQRGSEEFMWLLRRAAPERRDRGGGREEMGARGEEEKAGEKGLFRRGSRDIGRGPNRRRRESSVLKHDRQIRPG